MRKRDLGIPQIVHMAVSLLSKEAQLWSGNQDAVERLQTYILPDDLKAKLS